MKITKGVNYTNEVKLDSDNPFPQRFTENDLSYYKIWEDKDCVVYTVFSKTPENTKILYFELRSKINEGILRERLLSQVIKLLDDV